MSSKDDAVKEALIVDAQARNISHDIRCTECCSQSIEDSPEDMSIISGRYSLLSQSGSPSVSTFTFSM